MIDFMMYYDSFQEADEADQKGNPNQSGSFIKAVHIYKIERDAEFPHYPDPEKEAWRKVKRAERHQVWLDNMGEDRAKRYLKLKAENEKKYRESMSAEKKAEYKRKAIERRKKSTIARKQNVKKDSSH